ncbi:50S ribosomal protein L30e [Archaeoglobus veneficus]|uniref:Large ribosomal subunit protein eL30 n=1 Tax=Archaeoglobus veneficus (strain DSM 11195 / SNP6) TaxID=693661 RepID=F2KNF2_ARCVS|nr:50S ribosomal protein L30e [Archaeoglobus veneficus]AEA47354.1 50S ribosomal protein L30e [Archaeoglobus veneficus SNP6]
MKVDIEKALRKALKTGRVYLGSKRTLKALKSGEAKLVVVAMNCPEDVMERIRSFDVPVVTFNGTNMELGAACGKPFSVAALAILEAGESEILNAA